LGIWRGEREWKDVEGRGHRGRIPANQPISDGEATDRRKRLRRKMADCPSK